MNVLIVHQNFPGQFPHITTGLLDRGDKVAVIASHTAKARPGVDLRRWQNSRSSTAGVFGQATRAEADLIRATAAANVALQLKKDGFSPDVIVGHPGWGETIHLKEIWPDAKVILLGELYYRSSGGDAGFDPEFGAMNLNIALQTNAKNATQALAYTLADRIICPTYFQASSFPKVFQPTIRVLHEGLDLDHAARRKGSKVKLPGGAGILDDAKPVVTFVNRTLEPLRGFHVFMRALPKFLAACPDARAIVVGLNLPSGYGQKSPVGDNWLAWAIKELGDKLDMSRIHMVGKVSYDTLIDIFSISWAHVYYTYPFVLSWSLIDAMACECKIIASDTPPLHDAIENGVEGLLLPFFDVDALSDAMIHMVNDPERFRRLGPAARQRALTNFNKIDGTARWLAEIDGILQEPS